MAANRRGMRGDSSNAAQLRLGRPTQVIGIDVLRRRIDQDVASAGCTGGDDYRLDRLLREPTEVVRGRSKEGQLLEGPQLGRQPTLVLGRLG